MITLGVIIAFLIGAVISTIVWFFIWRNNKKKFMDILAAADGIVGKYKDKESIEAAITSMLVRFK